VKKTKPDAEGLCAVVCGAGGFIGHHLVGRLKQAGYRVRGVDVKSPSWSDSAADEFLIHDLRDPAECAAAVAPMISKEPVDIVFQLAADMGGVEFMYSSECAILRNNSAININMVHAAVEAEISRYFFSSSVCVYRDMIKGETAISEDDAYPAAPANEYGWEKLFAERTLLAYARRHGIDVRIARFQNCYGPEGSWRGGREKAPAALCRKVAEAADNGIVEVWGDGKAVRSFIHVRDLVEGVLRLVESDLKGPVNIGSREYVSVDELLSVVTRSSGKNVIVRHVNGPVGVQSRNFSNDRIESLGWTARIPLSEGIPETYAWVAAQVERASAATGDEHRYRRNPAEALELS
jgi:nucleoside-diphosphate-sugar epimerase